MLVDSERYWVERETILPAADRVASIPAALHEAVREAVGLGA